MTDPFAPDPEMLDVIASYPEDQQKPMLGAIMKRGISLGMDPTSENTLYVLGLLEGEAGKDASLIDNGRYMAGWSDGCVTFRQSQARLN